MLGVNARPLFFGVMAKPHRFGFVMSALCHGEETPQTEYATNTATIDRNAQTTATSQA